MGSIRLVGTKNYEDKQGMPIKSFAKIHLDTFLSSSFLINDTDVSDGPTLHLINGKGAKINLKLTC